LVPLSLSRRGGRDFREEAKLPLSPSLPLPLVREGGQGDGFVREAKPLFNSPHLAD